MGGISAAAGVHNPTRTEIPPTGAVLVAATRVMPKTRFLAPNPLTSIA